MEQDKELIKACLKNNRVSQQQLYQKYAEVMLGVCYRYTKSMADAEDVLQEGFIRVFKNLQQYRFDGELGGMDQENNGNYSLELFKRNAKYQNDLAFDKIELHPVTDENPEIILNTKELASLIQQLPTGYQTIFNLHAVEGYSHVEIGAMLGITDGTSRSQYARARALMIAWIKKYYSDNKLHTYAKQ